MKSGAPLLGLAKYKYYGFKQDQLRSTIFDSITNYIFSLLKAIYSVVFAFVTHRF